jgi:hypothetical protein
MSEPLPELDDEAVVEPIDISGSVHPDGWIYLTHPGIDGTTRIPADPDVLVAQQARGWVVVEVPEPSIAPARTARP